MTKSFQKSKLLVELHNLSSRLTIWRLPPHPYPEQFSVDLDQPPVEWAKRFIMIASTPRCGSHLLGHMLLETKSCGVPMEYLHPDSARYWRARFGTVRLEKLFPRLVRLRTTPNGTFCFKAHWSQFAPMRNRVETLTNGCGLERIIWIARRNQLSQAISWVIAEQTGAWIAGAPVTGSAHYDYEAILRKARRARADNLAWRDYLTQHHPDRYMTVIYEDLLADAVLRDRLATFLGLPSGSALVPADRTKRQAGNLSDQWKDRVCAELRSEDAWLLDQPVWHVSSQV